MQTAFFTICATNYVAFARMLMQGIARHHPDAARYLVLADEPHVDLSGDGFKVILARDLALPEFDSFCFRYEISELCTAIKPYAFLELFKRNFECCIFLDPDICVHGPLDEALNALSGDAQSVLTPHRLTPDVRSGWPTDRDLLQVGAYNLGFLALKRTREVVGLVEWWARRLEKDCLVALERGLFVDQKWIDLWPSFCAGTTILRHPGYNVAYWNLAERKIERSGDRYLVNGQRLVFFHFSGVMPHRPDVLSKYQVQFTSSNIGAADELLQSYITAVLASGHAELERIACSYARFENGVPIPPLARSLFRRDERRFPDPFRSVFRALQEPSDKVAPNPEGVVSVAAYEAWKVRIDVQQTFAINTAEGQVGVARWFAGHGCTESGLDPIFARSVAERLARVPPELAGSRSAGLGSTARRALALYRRSPLLQRAWSRLPADLRARSRKLVLEAAFRLSPRRWRRAAHGAEPQRQGALLVGYPRAEMGVGQSLRGLAESSRVVGIPFAVFDFGLDLPLRQEDDSLAGDITWSDRFNCNVFCVNADQWPVARARLGGEFFAGRYNILRPFWELARLPSAWAATLTGLQEIWAPTRFVAGAFARATSCPIEIVPVPVLVKPDNALTRASFDLPERRFLFCFSFDFASYITRKNPEGVVAAFKRAFPNGDEPVGLVIKMHGTGAFEDRRDWLVEEAADPRISVIDRTLTREQLDALLSLTDCYVSLHRSEGFGFGMAEAMTLGKPVIGTDYSGNTDFLSETTGFPVSYRLTAVAPGTYPDHVHQVWAEADLEHAAWLMREVVAGNSNVVQRAEAGRRYMAQHHSPMAVGRKCRDRLVQLALIAPAPSSAGSG
jgi:glycosyltransferase involved in cell wall biosynthesis